MDALGYKRIIKGCPIKATVVYRLRENKSGLQTNTEGNTLTPKYFYQMYISR